jgi:hypothetical protein
MGINIERLQEISVEPRKFFQHVIDDPLIKLAGDFVEAFGCGAPAQCVDGLGMPEAAPPFKF